MGQGTESCNGYDIDYAWWSEEDTLWNGTTDYTTMSRWELKRAISLTKIMAETTMFESDRIELESWVSVMIDHLYTLPETKTKYVAPQCAKPTRGKKVDLVCHCGTTYSAKLSELKRGNALSCCKRCASIRRSYNKPAAKTVSGQTVKQFLKTENEVKK